ncbi:MAG: hypothetical protein E4G94_01680 [ANME-2 cluster archaeon]|jgi:hypothetical protein|nr:MAG: hypothetical protein E4G94_01680 [ANME-2 cluster archaeon]
MKNSEIIIILTIIGTVGIIALTLPLIEVYVNEYYLEIKEIELENEVHVNYPVTIENDWNCTAIFYELSGDVYYIYWIVPIAENRDVDFHIYSNDNSERMILSDDEFVKFQKGEACETIVDKDETTIGTLSFICNSSGEYVFVCIPNSDLESMDKYLIKASWLFSTREEEITSYRTEIEYKVEIKVRSIPKKVSITQNLFGDY